MNALKTSCGISINGKLTIINLCCNKHFVYKCIVLIKVCYFHFTIVVLCHYHIYFLLLSCNSQSLLSHVVS